MRLHQMTTISPLNYWSYRPACRCTLSLQQGPILLHIRLIMSTELEYLPYIAYWRHRGDSCTLGLLWVFQMTHVSLVALIFFAGFLYLKWVRWKHYRRKSLETVLCEIIRILLLKYVWFPQIIDRQGGLISVTIKTKIVKIVTICPWIYAWNYAVQNCDHGSDSD